MITCVSSESLLFQPEYRILKKTFEEQLPKESILRLFDNQNEIMQLNLEEMTKHQTQKSDIECKFFENASDVPNTRELSQRKRILWYSTTYC